MPYDGSGNFNRTFPAGGWQGDATANVKIKADRHDQHDSDLAAGLTNAICKDGQSQPTANIPFNSKKITNLGTPTTGTDAATKAYADSIRAFASGTTLTGTSTGSSPAFVSTAYMGYTEADMSIVGRKNDAGTTPPVIKRIAFNDKVDGTGSDVFVINEDGTVSSRAADGTYKVFAPVTARANNRVVNGNMAISQEFGAGPTTVNGTSTLAHMVDQFNCNVNSGSVTFALAVAQFGNMTPLGSSYRAQIKVTTAKASLTGTEYCIFASNIEGLRVCDDGWGFAGARQIIVRFGWRSPAGTYSLAIRNNAANRSYQAVFTITAGQANTDTEQVFVIPGDVTGTWQRDTAIGMTLYWCIGASATNQSTVNNTWQANGMFCGLGVTNGLATVNNTFELFDVGLYIDPDATGVPPKWQPPDPSAELLACQRYYEKSYNTADKPGTAAASSGFAIMVSSATVLRIVVQYKAVKRVATAITTYSDVTGVSGKVRDASAGADINYSGFTNGETSYATSIGVAAGSTFTWQWVANARM